MSVFEVKNICFKYDKYEKNSPNVLSDISFNVENGDFIALIGKSGSGKSTLISHLNGLLKADSGEILFNGKNIYDNDFDLTKLRFNCGIVFQHPEYQLFADTVIEDVSFGVIKKGFDKDTAYKKALDTLKLLDIENLKDETPFNLSGGEKRKVAFCGIFAMEPEVLILDEPDAGLDSMSKKHMYEFLKKLNEEKKVTIIFITHNLDDVMEYAKKVILINDGEIVNIDTPYNVLSNEKILASCNLIVPDAIRIAKILKEHNIHVPNLRYNDILDAIKNNSI